MTTIIDNLDPESVKKSDSWLIKNAIGCFLYHYPDHDWAPRYRELVKIDEFLPEKKPRPARRAKRSQSREPDVINGKDKV